MKQRPLKLIHHQSNLLQHLEGQGVSSMDISGASKAAGLPVKTVRYYADIGLVKVPSRSEAGYRTYNDVAVRKLVFVRRSREFGFSIEECRELLGLYQDRDRTSSEVKRIASKRLEEIEVKQRELHSLHDELAPCQWQAGEGAQTSTGHDSWQPAGSAPSLQSSNRRTPLLVLRLHLPSWQVGWGSKGRLAAPRKVPVQRSQT